MPTIMLIKYKRETYALYTVQNVLYSVGLNLEKEKLENRVGWFINRKIVSSGLS